VFHLLSEELGHGAWVAGTGYSMGFRRDLRQLEDEAFFYFRMVVGNGFFFSRGFNLICASLFIVQSRSLSPLFFFTGLFVLSATFLSVG
jgi:hypothetical protein